jgi:hypothetical protein
MVQLRLHQAGMHFVGQDHAKASLPGQIKGVKASWLYYYGSRYSTRPTGQFKDAQRPNNANQLDEGNSTTICGFLFDHLKIFSLREEIFQWGSISSNLSLLVAGVINFVPFVDWSIE